MKSFTAKFLILLSILCCQLITVKGAIGIDSLDKALSKIKNPDKKVDLILAFLDKPENQYLENADVFANRALQIAQQTNYAKGEINAMLKLSNYYYRSSNYKKAMELVQKAREMSEDMSYNKELAESYRLIGSIFNELDDFDNSSQYFFKSLNLFEKLDDKEGISQSTGDIGKAFYGQHDYKKALHYFDKSLSIAERIRYQSEIKRQYNNIAAVYGIWEKYDTSIIFLQKAMEINIKIGDKYGQGINSMNIGFNQLNKGNYNKALVSFQHALDVFTILSNQLHIAKCYLNFGFCYSQMKREVESIDCFQKALQIGQKKGYYSIIYTAASELNQKYAENNDTVNAYKYLHLEKVAGDSIFELKKKLLISKFELQYLYEKREIERRQTQQTKNIVIVIIITGLLAGLVVLGLLFSRQRLKSKLVVVEKEKVELEKVKVELELDIKDRELTVNMISLIKKNELLTDISNRLAHLERIASGKESKDTIAKISQDLRNSINDKMFNEFSHRFKEVHAGFYEKLLLTYPELTQNELKLCAFLRLNMSSKDIAELTGQQVTAIDKARFRLREKLNLPNSKTNLVTFLAQI